ncbi:TPA: tautomerase family protein [Serratia rubidaea]|uniref:tautomerase family protein n=1 Tax=Serratia rubidaea TaxID=61652 RepID=UPI0023AE91BD|nr:tautomerase family protein [Serratia rubidaea]MDK1702702.1 tautomerase family protein [Serratia rubidaea]HDJ1440174.1 tautomerase family protein [Serratia rubidaea]HDJ1448549.1 tautomerase family protein [Serratia rubidaea]HDJ1461802.1 tautomerase family protein [Serratia rubidaea]HDJ2772382.1 tautomerase family protein [Serratia rubidaea]
MPIVRIEETTRRDARQKQAVIATVFNSLRQVLGVSDEELQARYQQYQPEDFVAPGGMADYLHIEIVMFKGRTLVSKKKLYRHLVDSLVTLLDISPAAIVILLREYEADNWGMRGGTVASEIDFGYRISV